MLVLVADKNVIFCYPLRMKYAYYAIAFLSGVSLTFSLGIWWVMANPTVRTVEVPVERVVYATPEPPKCVHEPLDRDNILLEVNEYRLEKGLPMLKSSLVLHEYSQLRANELKAKGDITHDSKYGDIYEWIRANRKPNLVSTGEVINIGSRTACESIGGFKSSPTHNAILIDPKAGQIGIGVSGSIVVLELGAL